jgi:hypothetical protein
MAKDIDTGMDKQDMKRLLMKSKSEPVSCAFGQGDEKTMALLMLDKVKQPKAVVKDLEKKFPNASNTRWGTAFVDVDADVKLVQFIVNKPISGVARKLVKTLKGTGFTKVEILLEDGSPLERDSEEDEAPVAAGAAPAEPAPPAQPAAAAETPAPPAAQPAEAATPNGAPLSTTYTKAGAVWTAARKKIEGDLEKLRSQILAAYAQDGIADTIDAAYRKRVAPVLQTLDESLAKKLAQAASSADNTEQATLAKEARDIVLGYQRFLAGDPTIADLDKNPFVSLQIGATLSGTLDALTKTIR